MITIPSRDEINAPTIVTGDEPTRRGINIGATATVTRNGRHHAAGLVTMVTTDAFEVTHDAGRELVALDPGPGVRQVVRVTYPDT